MNADEASDYWWEQRVMGAAPEHRRPEENDMTTTRTDIEQRMAEAVAEHGHESWRTLGVAETMDQDFDDIVYLGDHRGEEARWGSRDHHVYRLADGTLIGVQYYAAATEMQESFYEGRVVELEERTVVTYVPKEAENR